VTNPSAPTTKSKRYTPFIDSIRAQENGVAPKTGTSQFLTVYEPVMQALYDGSAQTYTRKVRAYLYNRILIGLGFAGIFISGVLSLAKIMDVVLPCGAGSSCETVTNDPSSMLFGVLPLAYIGFGAYIVLTGLAFLRSTDNPANFLKLSLIGYGISAFGMLTSIALQVYSLFVIGALCKWCMASAITMTATLIVYALMYQDASECSSELLAQAQQASSFTDLAWRAGLGVVAVLGLAFEGYSLRFADHSKGRVLTHLDERNNPLIPADPYVYGDLKAPIKVIEFADLNCPACQRDSPRLKDFVRQHAGKICVVFRNCPLPMHHTSQLAAIIDTYAAEKGHFWDYTMAVMGTKKEIKDPNELFGIASTVGLDVDDLKRRIQNSEDPVYKRLAKDESAAGAVGVDTTPTFVVEMPGMQPKAFTGGGMFDAFGQRPYTDYLGKKA
jgi:protein-disulfide isomerase